MNTWFGHNRLSNFTNVWLAVPPIAANWLMITAFFPYPEYVLFLIVATWVFFPHALYLFCEVKHLLFKDGIADDLSPRAVLFFAMQSGMGLAASVLATLFVAMMLANILPVPLTVTLVSMLFSIGAVIGLHDITFLDGVKSPRYVLRFTVWLFKSPIDRALILELTLLNGVCSLAFQLAYLS